MDENLYDSERPPDEVWWERELNRSEKLKDNYMTVFEEHSDWAIWKSPEEFFTQPGRLSFESGFANARDNSEEEENEAFAELEDEEILAEGEEDEDDDCDEDDDDDEEIYLIEDDDDDDLAEDDPEFFVVSDEDDDGDESDAEQDEGYISIAKQAREFALRVFELKNVPMNAEILYLSAGNIGSNLAGGHGLGYDEETLCGNIVKCRWALTDSEFCIEMLDHLHRRTGQSEFGSLAVEGERVSSAIKERISRLRSRVWW